jgi:hypothetical protein
MSWGTNAERRVCESFVFHGCRQWQGWSRRKSIDVRWPAESRNVVGASTWCFPWSKFGLLNDYFLDHDVILHHLVPFPRRGMQYSGG